MAPFSWQRCSRCGWLGTLPLARFGRVRACPCCGTAQPAGATSSELSGRGLLQVLEQAPVPVLAAFLDPGSTPRL
ncbi:MAG: hypothetical protein ABIO70_13090 [Pseudomonadota bacterium]